MPASDVIDDFRRAYAVLQSNRIASSPMVYVTDEQMYTLTAPTIPAPASPPPIPRAPNGQFTKKTTTSSGRGLSAWFNKIDAHS